MHLMVLLVETTVDPVRKTLERVEPDKNGEFHNSLLLKLNSLSKNGFLLFHWKGDLYRISHTSGRPPSTFYHKEKIVYHPLEYLIP